MNDTGQILFLSETQLEALGIATAEVVDSIESLIRSRAEGTVWSAPKAVILPGDGRYMMAALAAADEPALLAVKTVVLNPRNPDNGLAQINGLVTMLSSETGLPVAVLDGNWITAVRTAGLSAVAAKHLARGDSKIAAFIGCGVQARSHLKAFADLFPLQAIRVFGRGRPNIDRLCAMADGLSLNSEVCGTADEALEGADLVVTSVTFSADMEPFLDPDRLAPGSFAAVTDLAAPWQKQRFTLLDRVVIDDLEQEAALPNKLVPPAGVAGDLEGLVTGRIPGRADGGERNAFVFRGHALGDLALSALAVRRYQTTA